MATGTMPGDRSNMMLVAAIPLAAPAMVGDDASAIGTPAADARLAAVEGTLQAMDNALAHTAPARAHIGQELPHMTLFPAGTGRAGTGMDAAGAAILMDGAAALARKYGVWLCPGTWVDERNRHVTGLFNPDGTLVATQAQTHLGPGETYSPATELVLADTPFGPVGFLVGHDAWVPEVGRILSRRGAKLLLAPVSGREPYSKWDQIAGAWAQVQQNQVFAAESGWIGPGHSGRPAVLAPCEMTDGLTGFLAGYRDERPQLAADEATGGAAAIAVIDDAARRNVIAQYDILGLQNPALYERYLPGLYRSPAPGSGYPGGGRA